MTFKIDKTGFYKNRKGEKVEIIRDWLWLDTKGRHYYDNGDRATLDETIVAKWTEQDELAHETDCESKNKFYLIFNPSQSAPKHRHYTLEEAQTEARRIAKRHPERTIYILETIAAYIAEVEIKEIKI